MMILNIYLYKYIINLSWIRDSEFKLITLTVSKASFKIRTVAESKWIEIGSQLTPNVFAEKMNTSTRLEMTPAVMSFAKTMAVN